MSKASGGKKQGPQPRKNKYDRRPYPQRRDEEFAAWCEYRRNQIARKARRP